LSSFITEKPGAPQPPPERNVVTVEKRGQTLRLAPEAWRQLKLLAVEREVPSHALLIEAVNDLFRKHGKPPIA